MDFNDLSLETRSVWAGEEEYLLDRATQVPVVHSVGFGYETFDEWYAVATGAAQGHIYGRNTNPTVAVLEDKIRALEGGEAATSASTGMAAISNTLYALLTPGKRVVSVKDTHAERACRSATSCRVSVSRSNSSTRPTTTPSRRRWVALVTCSSSRRPPIPR